MTPCYLEGGIVGLIDPADLSRQQFVIAIAVAKKTTVGDFIRSGALGSKLFGQGLGAPREGYSRGDVSRRIAAFLDDPKIAKHPAVRAALDELDAGQDEPEVINPVLVPRDGFYQPHQLPLLPALQAIAADRSLTVKQLVASDDFPGPVRGRHGAEVWRAEAISEFIASNREA